MKPILEKLGKRKLIIIAILLVLIIVAAIVIPIAVINSRCDHVYDNACDTTCNECGEERSTEHSWILATCTEPKTCSVCGTTEGKANGHTPMEDDGDCTTEVKCSVCETVTTAAATKHIPRADDDDCTTPLLCTYCTTVITEAKEHDFTGTAQMDADGHWHVCENDGCTMTDTKTGHTEGADGKCTVCGYTITPHVHNYTSVEYDDTHHWNACACGEDEPNAQKILHSATDDGDCTTDVVCSCGYIVKAKEETHTPKADDGNCTTEIQCQNCDKVAVAAKEEHNDQDGDYECDNDGCQIIVEGAPEDDNEGIDLPIDRK